jgi:hypothetical protein
MASEWASSKVHEDLVAKVTLCNFVLGPLQQSIEFSLEISRARSEWNYSRSLSAVFMHTIGITFSIKLGTIS